MVSSGRGAVSGGARLTTVHLLRSNAVAISAVTTGAVAICESTLRRDGWLLAVLVVVAPVAAAVAVIDARLHRIPNGLTVAAAGIAVLAIGARAVAEQSADPALRAAIAALVVGLLYLALWRFANLGLGDVKLVAALALFAGWSGWQTVAAFVVVAHLLPVPFAVWRLVRRRLDRIAFGPALVVGLYAAVALTALAR